MSIFDLLSRYSSPVRLPAGQTSSKLSFPLDIDGEVKNESIQIVCDDGVGGDGNDHSGADMEKNLITFKV